MEMKAALRLINYGGSYCWYCKKGVEEGEVMVLEENGVTYAELCFECYDQNHCKTL